MEPPGRPSASPAAIQINCSLRACRFRETLNDPMHVSVNYTRNDTRNYTRSHHQKNFNTPKTNDNRKELGSQ